MSRRRQLNLKKSKNYCRWVRDNLNFLMERSHRLNSFNPIHFRNWCSININCVSWQICSYFFSWWDYKRDVTSGNSCRSRSSLGLSINKLWFTVKEPPRYSPKSINWEKEPVWKYKAERESRNKSKTITDSCQYLVYWKLNKRLEWRKIFKISRIIHDS